MPAHVPKPAGTQLSEGLRLRPTKVDSAILDALITAGGEPVTNAQLADRNGYATASSGFNEALGFRQPATLLHELAGLGL